MVISLQLEDITEGLHIANKYGESILHKIGETYQLDDGNAFSLKPLGIFPCTECLHTPQRE